MSIGVEAYISPADILVMDDSLPDAKVAAMLEDAFAQAASIAPAIRSNDFLSIDGNRAVVKSILRSAVLRWVQSTQGSMVMDVSGPFTHSEDTRGARRNTWFWAEEVQRLKTLAVASSTRRAYVVSAMPPLSVAGDLYPWDVI